MHARCETCGDEFEAKTSSHERQCANCEAEEVDAMRESYRDPFFADTRRERMRERLGVSGDVDE